MPNPVAPVPEETVIKLLEEYSGLAAIPEPVVQVPLSNLRGDGYCRGCRLFYENPDAFRVMSAMLIKGERVADVQAVLERMGVTLSGAGIARHRKLHINEAMWQIATETQEFRILAQQAMNIPTGDLATLELQLSSAALLKALRKIDRKKLEKMAADDPAGMIRLANEHSKALANVMRSDRMTQLCAVKLQFERARASMQEGTLLQRALDAMRRELAGTPEGVKLLEAISNLINSPAPQ